MSTAVSRGRGRPPGVRNGEGQPREPIKTWTYQHEQVVMLHIAGKANDEIAELTDYTTTRVSQILNDPQAERVKALAIRKLRSSMTENLEGQLLELAEESAKRLGETIKADFALGTRAKHHQDKMSLDLLKGTGFLNKEKPDDTDRRRDPLPEKRVNRLVDALEVSNEAAKLHRAEREVVLDAPSSPDMQQLQTGGDDGSD